MKRKIIILTTLMLITIITSQTALASQTTSGTGTTNGGTKVGINYFMTCTARVDSYVDQTRIKIQPGAILNLSYTNLKHTGKDGKVTAGANGTKNNVGNATWTTTAGKAGKAYSSSATYKASSSKNGSWTKSVSCFF